MTGTKITIIPKGNTTMTTRGMITAICRTGLGSHFAGRRSVRKCWWLLVFAAVAVGCGQGGGEDHEGHDHGPGEEHGQEEDEHAHGEEGVIVLTAEQMELAGIELATVQAGGEGAGLQVPGTVSTTTSGQALITSPVSGKVTRLLVSLGQTVQAGQALAVVQSPDLADAQARVSEAARQLSAARSLVDERQGERKIAETDLSAARQVLAQQRALAEAGAFNQAPVLAAEKELTDARSELLSLQTEEATHQEQLRRMERLFAEGLVSKVDLESARLEVQQDQILISRAKARVSVAESTYEREKRIAEQNLLNRRELLTAESNVTQSQNAVRQADIRLTAARQASQRAERAVRDAESSYRAMVAGGTASGANVTLRAPMAGTISHIDATLGQAVERSTELLKIENLKSVWVTASVPQSELSRISVGTGCRVSVNGATLRGSVQVVGNQVDPETRTVPIQCLIANAEGLLKPGMFTQVSFDSLNGSGEILISRDAVQEVEGEQVVFVPGEHEGEFEMVDVELGARKGDLVEIIAGLGDGDRYVAKGAFTLKAQAMKEELGHGHAH